MNASPTQADILAALSQPGSSLFTPRVAPSTVSLSDIPFDQLINTEGDVPCNARGLYCVRGCGSIILSPRVGEYVVAEAGVLPEDPAAPFVTASSPAPLTPSSSSSAPPPTRPRGYWHVRGSPMSFENIGFSKTPPGAIVPIGAPGAGGKIKFLACAECDLGPIGWSTEGGQDAWLAIERVRYKAA